MLAMEPLRMHAEKNAAQESELTTSVAREQSTLTGRTAASLDHDTAS